MEAHLLTLPGLGPLPEQWRTARVPSFRRLLTVVRHADERSAIGRVLNDGRMPWSAEAQVLDDLRRAYLSVHLKDGAANPPHPLSPAAGTKADREREAQAQEARHRRAEQREASRQQRLAERGGGA